MEVSFKKEGSVLTAVPVGRIDSLSAGDLQAAIEKEITAEIKKVVIDMSHIDYVSSKGIRILLILHRMMAQKDGLVLTSLNNSVKEVLRLSALLNTFTIQ